MASVSSIVKEIVTQNKLLQEGLRQQLLSYGAVAEKIKDRVEKESGSKVKESAIVMALRRYSESVGKKESKKIKLRSDIIMKTGLAYLSITKSPNALIKLEKFYGNINPEKDTLNIIHGNHEISIITNEKYAKKIIDLIGRTHVKSEEDNLVSLSINLGRDFLYTPGIIFTVSRKLYWDDVNIFELITTATELTCLFQQKDAMKAYNAVSELVGK